MTGGEKLLLGLFGFLFFSAKSAAPRTAPKTPPLSPKKAPKAAQGDGRPEAAKPDPGPVVDLTPDGAQESPRPPKQPEGSRDADDKPKAPKKPEAPKTSAKAQAADRNKAAIELADLSFREYVKRGIQEDIAAAEALSVYMLAGGNDPKIIKDWQRLMGLERTGEYDKETSNFVAKKLDMALDGAINTILQQLIAGEQPNTVGGNVLNQYIQEALDIQAPIPKEKIAALQILLGVAPLSGRYDQATKDKLTELGIVPLDLQNDKPKE